MIRAGLLMGLGLLLAGCRAAPPPAPADGEAHAAYAQRLASLTGWSHWGFRGRLSVDDGEDGGSGRLSWVRDGASLSLSFRGALGRGAWQMTAGPGGATLEFADGSLAEAADVEGLIESETGWTLPIEAMEFWVRGLGAPGPMSVLELDASGRPLRLVQFGWVVEFSRYGEETVALPGRIEATRAPYRVKLVFGRWDVPEDGGDRA